MIIGRACLLLASASVATPTGAQTTSPPAAPRIDPGLALRTAQGSEPATTVPATPAIAARPETPVASLPARLLARAIAVEGADDLPPDQLAAATAPFVGHLLSPTDLQDLLSAVSGVARARGYIFAHSTIPPQSAPDGALRLHLDEGRVDSVRLTGASLPAAMTILQQLEGHAPTRAEVERRLLLVGDLPGVTVGKASFTVENGRGVLTVPIALRRVDGSVTLDNRGLTALGPERARLAMNAARLLTDSDLLSAQVLVTPLQPRELVALFGRYAIQPTGAGTEFAVYGSFGATHAGGLGRDDDPHGTSESVGVSASQVLARSARTSLWVTGEGDWIGVDDWSRDVLIERDRVAMLSASVNGFTPVAGGRLRAGAGVAQGVLALGATRRDDPLASRFDAGSDFTLFNAWANWEGKLSGPFSTRLAAVSQLSTDPLPAVEQLTIGGTDFGRGYNWSERAGDEGVLGSAELRADLLARNTGALRWAQVYAFGDAGSVRNLESDFATGDLYSAGAGARLVFSHRLRLDLEAAFPINEVRYDSGDKSPRMSVSLTSRF